MRTNFLDRVQVTTGGRTADLPELLRHDRELSAALHVRDRVHTYGSFSIADLRL